MKINSKTEEQNFRLSLQLNYFQFGTQPEPQVEERGPKGRGVYRHKR